VPWVEKLSDRSGISGVAGPNRVILRASVPVEGKDMRTVAAFTVSDGETVTFVLTHQASHLAIPPALDALAARESALKLWREWSSQSNYQGPWREAVQRSLIILKALTYHPTGGIVAAPTTSLPEKIGGARN
jgi:glucoamylase